MKIVILFLKFLPYHLARIEALGKIFKVIGVQVSDIDKDYDFNISISNNNNFIFESLFRGKYIEDIPGGDQSKAVFDILNKHMPDVVIIPGWGWYFSRIALNWAKSNNKLAILMSDSKNDDKNRSAIKEWLKRRLVKKFDCAIVAGSPHKEYLISLGMPAERIMLGFDVVDNEYIANITKKYIEEGLRPIANKYFLIISRFIKRKNISSVIDAYKIYKSSLKEHSWDLVFCGSGREESNLRAKISREGITGVHFTGSVELNEVCRYLAFSEVFIHAAIQEQWGLVVNEAMAAAKPIIISESCGCRYDLVCDGKNGFIFDPYDANQLSGIMANLTLGKFDLRKMGNESEKIVSFWNPQLFANNIKLLIEKYK